MKGQWHINPETGEIGRCGATKRCPFTGENSHFDTIQEAADFVESQLEKEYSDAGFEDLSESFEKDPIQNLHKPNDWPGDNVKDEKDSDYRPMDRSGQNHQGKSFSGPVNDSGWRKANFSHCDLQKIGFEGDFSEANFSDSMAYRADFRNVNLTDANFRNTNLQAARFENANLTGVDFSGADLTDADFHNARLVNVKIDENTIFNYVNTDKDKLLRSSFIGAIGKANRDDEIDSKRYGHLKATIENYDEHQRRLIENYMSNSTDGTLTELVRFGVKIDPHTGQRIFDPNDPHDMADWNASQAEAARRRIENTKKQEEENQKKWGSGEHIAKTQYDMQDYLKTTREIPGGIVPPGYELFPAFYDLNGNPLAIMTRDRTQELYVDGRLTKITKRNDNDLAKRRNYYEKKGVRVGTVIAPAQVTYTSNDNFYSTNNNYYIVPGDYSIGDLKPTAHNGVNLQVNEKEFIPQSWDGPQQLDRLVRLGFINKTEAKRQLRTFVTMEESGRPTHNYLYLSDGSPAFNNGIFHPGEQTVLEPVKEPARKSRNLPTNDAYSDRASRERFTPAKKDEVVVIKDEIARVDSSLGTVRNKINDLNQKYFNNEQAARRRLIRKAVVSPNLAIKEIDEVFRVAREEKAKLELEEWKLMQQNRNLSRDLELAEFEKNFNDGKAV